MLANGTSLISIGKTASHGVGVLGDESPADRLDSSTTTAATGYCFDLFSFFGESDLAVDSDAASLITENSACGVKFLLPFDANFAAKPPSLATCRGPDLSSPKALACPVESAFRCPFPVLEGAAVPELDLTRALRGSTLAGRDEDKSKGSGVRRILFPLRGLFGARSSAAVRGGLGGATPAEVANEVRMGVGFRLPTSVFVGSGV